MLVHNLHANGALTRNHIHIVIGRDIDQSLLFTQLLGMQRRFIIVVAKQHHLGAAIPHRIHFDAGRISAHNDGGANTQLLRRNSHALGVVARRGGNHPDGLLLFCQLSHFVVGPAQLKTVDRLHVFALKADLNPKAFAQ